MLKLRNVVAKNPWNRLMHAYPLQKIQSPGTVIKVQHLKKNSGPIPPFLTFFLDLIAIASIAQPFQMAGPFLSDMIACQANLFSL